MGCCIILEKVAGVAELADAPDLGSGGNPVQVQVLSPALRICEAFKEHIGNDDGNGVFNRFPSFYLCLTAKFTCALRGKVIR